MRDYIPPYRAAYWGPPDPPEVTEAEYQEWLNECSDAEFFEATGRRRRHLTTIRLAGVCPLDLVDPFDEDEPVSAPAMVMQQ